MPKEEMEADCSVRGSLLINVPSWKAGLSGRLSLAKSSKSLPGILISILTADLFHDSTVFSSVIFQFVSAARFI